MFLPSLISSDTEGVICISINTMAMIWTLLVSTLLMLLQPQIGHGWRSPALTPPDGNSLKLKTKAYNGKYVYTCQNLQWVPVKATATLVNISDNTQSFGRYSLVYRPGNPDFLGMWYLDNGGNEMAESGKSISVVAGQGIASEPSDYSGIPQVLAQASYHQNSYSVAAQISYIQRLFTKGGLPPRNKKCTGKATKDVVVPFQAEFWFYTQDFLPPTVPSSVAIPSNSRMVMGFFCKGVAVYTYNGTAWRRTDIHGKLFNVPGGNYLGTYYVKRTPDGNGGNFCLETINPYAWSVTAKIEGHSTQVDPDSLPWSLFNVTSSSGNTTLLGPYNYFQMIGCRGGLPPKAEDSAPKGATYTSVFTNQFWIYSPA